MAEIQAFYTACLRRSQEKMKSAAITSRVGGATDKAFKQFMKNLDKTTGAIDRSSSRPKKPKRTDDEAFKQFFGQVSRLPTASQAQKAVDKTRREGRSAEEVSLHDFDGTTTVPVRSHKGPAPR